jgi:hypothetical protein
VTDIVRRRDLVASASVHRLLQALLGLPVPIYHHHRPILDQAGKKLSKTTQSTFAPSARAGRNASRRPSHGQPRFAWLTCDGSPYGPRSRGVPCSAPQGNHGEKHAEEAGGQPGRKGEA